MWLVIPTQKGLEICPDHLNYYALVKDLWRSTNLDLQAAPALMGILIFDAKTKNRDMGISCSWTPDLWEFIKIEPGTLDEFLGQYPHIFIDML